MSAVRRRISPDIRVISLGVKAGATAGMHGAIARDEHRHADVALGDEIGDRDPARFGGV
jgi:hypothetical protein